TVPTRRAAAREVFTARSHATRLRSVHSCASELEGVSVPRTENDTWEITQSVGATALGVAAARAAETESATPLIRDPFARVFIDAAGDGLWTWFAAPNLPAEVTELEPD